MTLRYIDEHRVLKFTEPDPLNDTPLQVGNTNQQDCHDNDCGDAYISDLHLSVHLYICLNKVSSEFNVSSE